MKIDLLETDSEEVKRDKIGKIEKVQMSLNQLQHNGYSTYFHYLPETKVFSGGFINFRKIETFKLKDFRKTFEDPIAKISPSFVRDIVARFSSYYARQGQPDFDLDHLKLL